MRVTCCFPLCRITDLYLRVIRMKGSHPEVFFKQAIVLLLCCPFYEASSELKSVGEPMAFDLPQLQKRNTDYQKPMEIVQSRPVGAECQNKKNL